MVLFAGWAKQRTWQVYIKRKSKECPDRLEPEEKAVFPEYFLDMFHEIVFPKNRSLWNCTIEILLFPEEIARESVRIHL